MIAEVFIIMGVSGSGKSTIGQALADHWNISFYDGDDFHPPENIRKMESGAPLNDDDRKSWLTALHTFIKKEAPKGSFVLACSALKEKYRKQLEGDGEVTFHWLYLKGSYELIRKRMEDRKNHFMPADLLKSQFNDLEEPLQATVLDIEKPVFEIVNFVSGLYRSSK